MEIFTLSLFLLYLFFQARRIASGENFLWSREKLPIPVTSPSIQNCQLIHVKYVLEVYVDIKCAPDMIIPFDIIIGTIPGHIIHGIC